MIRRLFRTIDPFIILVTFIVAMGLSALFSIGVAARDFEPWNQVLYVAIGIGVMIVAARVNYQVWRRYAFWIYLIVVFLLILVLFLAPIQGSSRWIDIGPFQLQPSEFAKLSLIVLLARVLSHETQISLWRFFLSILYTAIPFGLVVIQPDLGTTLVFAAIWLLMIVMANVKRQYLIILFTAGLLAIPIGLPLLKPYQRDRLLTFMSPASDLRGSGYNVNQATIAIGNGGWLGANVQDASQSELKFLPSQHTDFIFAVIAEKFGFIGSILVMFGLVAIIGRAIFVGWRSPDKFGLLLAIGIAAMLATHTIINIGMNLRLMPVTGLPLPFLSYGGSHIVVDFLLIGILLSIIRHNQDLRFAGGKRATNIELSS
jgi:rod shape determining protein RodA